MRHVPFVAFDFCDFVTYTLAGIAFALCLYMEAAAQEPGCGRVNRRFPGAKFRWVCREWSRRRFPNAGLAAHDLARSIALCEPSRGVVTASLGTSAPTSHALQLMQPRHAALCIESSARDANFHAHHGRIIIHSSSGQALQCLWSAA
jgi:hypothetical protein